MVNAQQRSGSQRASLITLGEVTSVSPGLVVFGIVVFVVVIAGGLLAIRQHNRMFPKGWDRTGWNPGSTRGWFATKFFWLSGGRG